MCIQSSCTTVYNLALDRGRRTLQNTAIKFACLCLFNHCDLYGKKSPEKSLLLGGFYCLFVGVNIFCVGLKVVDA